MNTYQVSSPRGSATIKAMDEQQARHEYMVQRWGDVSDHIVPRYRNKDGHFEPYRGHGLSVRLVRLAA